MGNRTQRAEGGESEGWATPCQGSGGLLATASATSGLPCQAEGKRHGGLAAASATPGKVAAGWAMSWNHKSTTTPDNRAESGECLA